MTWWDWFWGHWWLTIDWGNAPAWVGSILTSGSFFLAVMILRHDRRERRRASADRFTTWYRFKNVAGKRPHIFVHLYNGNDAPVSNIVLKYPLENTALSALNSEKDSILEVVGKERAELKAELEEGIKHYDLVVTFTDPEGRVWIRNAMSGRYISNFRFVVLGMTAASRQKRFDLRWSKSMKRSAKRSKRRTRRELKRNSKA